ncbi:hypothetical protein VTK26DRAFT_1226 [Humicola hyalothermophila]
MPPPHEPSKSSRGAGPDPSLSPHLPFTAIRCSPQQTHPMPSPRHSSNGTIGPSPSAQRAENGDVRVQRLRLRDHKVRRRRWFWGRCGQRRQTQKEIAQTAYCDCSWFLTCCPGGMDTASGAANGDRFTERNPHRFLSCRCQAGTVPLETRSEGDRAVQPSGA